MSGRTLEPNQVHVYRIDVAGSDFDACFQYLALDERVRCEANLRPVDQRRYACGRAALRRILSDYLGTEPGAVRFCYSRWRKPHLDPAATLSFNLSHSGDWVLIAIAAHRVGADVEMHREMHDMIAVARRVFGPTELAVVDSARGAAQAEAFFCAWARKEAYLKMHGFGIVDGLSSIDLRASSTRGDALVAARGAEPRERLALFDVPIAAGYAAAVAVEQSGVECRLELLDPAKP